jgi:hypothetical protein
LLGTYHPHLKAKYNKWFLSVRRNAAGSVDSPPPLGLALRTWFMGSGLKKNRADFSSSPRSSGWECIKNMLPFLLSPHPSIPYPSPVRSLRWALVCVPAL